MTSARLLLGTSKNALGRVRRLLHQPDFRQSPFRAITRRLAWRLHWALSSNPVVLSDWWSDLLISLPHSGSAAHVFYERRPTEPDLATELVKRLGLGGVFIDVGAHIGMYSLIAARVVETTGQVFAIEPQQACWTALQRNILLNGLDNIAHVPAAVGARDGQARFSSNSRSMGGMIAENGESTVPLMRLDTFARDHSLHYIDVLKLDAAGNEYAALRGADELLAGRRIGAILCKLYRPSVTEDRFNYNASLVVRHLREAHYLVSVLPAGTQPKRDSCDQHDVAELFDWTTYTRTLLAVPSELTGTENRNGH